MPTTRNRCGEEDFVDCSLFRVYKTRVNSARSEPRSLGACSFGRFDIPRCRWQAHRRTPDAKEPAGPRWRLGRRGGGLLRLLLDRPARGLWAGPAGGPVGARRRHRPEPIVLGRRSVRPLAIALGLFTEYRFAPFADDDSLGYFLAHVLDLRPLTLLMIGLGGLIGFWVPFRRRKPV